MRMGSGVAMSEGLRMHRVKLDAVAHGNHGLSEHVIVEDVVHRRAAA